MQETYGRDKAQIRVTRACVRLAKATLWDVNRIQRREFQMHLVLPSYSPNGGHFEM